MTNPTTDRLAEVLDCDREAFDDRVRPLLLAQAATRDAAEWHADDAVQVIVSLLAKLDLIQSQQAEIGAAYEEIGRLKEKLTQSERHIEDVNAHLPKYREALRQLKIGQAEIERLRDYITERPSPNNSEAVVELLDDFGMLRAEIERKDAALREAEADNDRFARAIIELSNNTDDWDGVSNETNFTIDVARAALNPQPGKEIDMPCLHQWQEMDSMFSNEHFTDVKCPLCNERGQRDEKTGEVFWPAT